MTKLLVMTLICLNMIGCVALRDEAGCIPDIEVRLKKQQHKQEPHTQNQKVENVEAPESI